MAALGTRSAAVQHRQKRSPVRRRAVVLRSGTPRERAAQRGIILFNVSEAGSIFNNFSAHADGR